MYIVTSLPSCASRCPRLLFTTPMMPCHPGGGGTGSNKQGGRGSGQDGNGAHQQHKNQTLADACLEPRAPGPICVIADEGGGRTQSDGEQGGREKSTLEATARVASSDASPAT